MLYVVASVILFFTLIGIYQKKFKVNALLVPVMLYVLAIVFNLILKVK